MKTPDEVLNLQTQLSQWSGTKKVAEWLAIVGLAIFAGGVVLIVLGKMKAGVLAMSPLTGSILCLLLRGEAVKRVRLIDAELSS